MGLRLRAALLTAVMVAAACSSAEPEPARPTASPTPFVAPPLRLPAVAAGAPCPTTAPRPWSGPGQATRVLGDGPLYPIADYFRYGGATLDLRPEDRQPDGTYTKKVRWLGVGYVGPVLVRAGRIDGRGSARAEFSYFGTVRDGGYYADLTEPENDLPATTTVSGPGCFAYLIDGTGFRSTIVFAAVLAPADTP